MVYCARACVACVDGNKLSGEFDVMADLEKERWERLLKWLKQEHGMKTDALRIEARDVPGAFAYYVQPELSRNNLYVYSCRRGQGLVCYGRDPGAYRIELFRNAFVLPRG